MSLITDPEGRVLNRRYRLISTLGSGASAHVFLAEDLSLQRLVAVKVLQPGLAEDQGFLTRFRAEARAVASLNHPNVLRVFDWGEDANGPFLVLEYLGGGSLRDLLARGTRLSHAQAAHIGIQAAQGLAYAHGRGIVHRDVKPANLLFDEDGRVRVADFGVARALAEAAWTEPIGALIGTARYAAPEQASGQPVDGRTDVYGLAIVLYEALTGEAPFTGETPMATLMARVGAPLPHHPALGPLDDILARAAAPERDARPDAMALAARLEALESSLPAPAPLPLRSPSGDPVTMVGRDSSEGSAGTRTALDGATVVVPSAGAAVFDVEALDGARAGVFDVEALGGDGDDQARRGDDRPRRTGGRRRRWPWVVAAVVVLAGAGGAVAAIKEKVFVPSHPVPHLTGLTVAAARSHLAPDHFSLATAGQTYSTTVPAGNVISQQPGPGVSLKQGATIHVVVSKGLPPVAVPSLNGLDCNAATRLLGEAHLKASCPTAAAAYSATVPTGQVINWSYDNILDAKSAPYGSTIEMAISKGPQPVAVPSVASDSYTAAQAALQAAGFPSTESQQTSTSVPSGEAIGTNPAAGTMEVPGTTVTVIVSSGPPMETVPNLNGDSVAAATTALNNAGLTLGAVYGPSKGSVFATSLQPGALEPEGTAVDIYTR